MKADDLVDAVTVAARFGVRVATVHEWRRRGIIPAIRPTKGVVRLRLTDGEKAVNEPCISRTANAKGGDSHVK